MGTKSTNQDKIYSISTSFAKKAWSYPRKFVKMIEKATVE
jgi:hypothetical protein